MQYTIIGGIKYKNKAAKKLNIPAFEPSKAEIYISDATPVCQVGDKVSKGDLIAKSINGFCVYASLSGDISRISEDFITVCGNTSQEAKPIDEYSGGFDAESRHELISYMLLAGLPDSTEILLRQEMGNTRRVIINCMYDPSKEHAEKIINGAKIILLALGIRSAVITIPKSSKGLAKAIEKTTYDREMFLIAMLPKIHPLEAPEAISRAVYPYTPFSDVYVLSPLSCMAVYDAFNESTAYTGHRIRVRYKKYYEDIFCPAGTSFGDLKKHFAENAPAKASKWQVVVGNSGIGFPQEDERIIGSDIASVTFKKGYLSLAEKHSSCISCGKCRKVCPAELSPYMIVSGAAMDGAFKCMSCGCCSKVCPVGIPLAEKIDNYLRGCNDDK